MRTKNYNKILIRRKRRVRASIDRGTAERPRVSVFRSNAHMYVQCIDDVSHKTVFSISSKDAKAKRVDVSKAKDLGKETAAGLKEKKIERIVFDRGEYKYHGRVKSFVEGLREGGIKV